jgi:hypothetical protein
MDMPKSHRTEARRRRQRFGVAFLAVVVAALVVGFLGLATGLARIPVVQAESLNSLTATPTTGMGQSAMAGNQAAAMPEATVPVTATVSTAQGVTGAESPADINATLGQVQEMMRTLQQTMAQLDSRASGNPTPLPPAAMPTPTVGGMATSGPPSNMDDIDSMLGQVARQLSQMQDLLNSMASQPGNSPGSGGNSMPPAAAPQPMASGTMTATGSMGAGASMDRPVPDTGMQPATQTAGNQPLAFRLEDGVKVFELTAQPVQWPISIAVTVSAWTFNGAVPGPMIRVTEGDRVRIVVKNQLPDATSIHWHGIPVPNAQDGIAQPPLTQNPILPGQTFTYTFVAGPSGTYMYHSHVDTDRQVNVGLFGAVIIDPKDPQAKPDKDVTLILNEWRYDVATGKTYPAMPGMSEPNYFTINGKTYPDIPALNVKQGERVRLRLINAGQYEHPMHLHGGSFKIVATDGNPVPEAAQLTKDTVAVHPGERYDIEFVANNPGQWLFHCHILHHVTSNDVEPGGLLMVINVK